jgi:hypothetical protein
MPGAPLFPQPGSEPPRILAKAFGGIRHLSLLTPPSRTVAFDRDLGLSRETGRYFIARRPVVNARNAVGLRFGRPVDADRRFRRGHPERPGDPGKLNEQAVKTRARARRRW